uniref:hypothetical protein n=1 Tax=Nonomuraea sp. CA-251285 TaxID=3240002 RepID=UPI003F49A99E
MPQELAAAIDCEHVADYVAVTAGLLEDHMVMLVGADLLEGALRYDLTYGDLCRDAGLLAGALECEFGLDHEM